jgi:hypothetical protein
MHIVADPKTPPLQRVLFITSPILFALGLLVVKPVNHIAWHWTASAGQATLVAAVALLKRDIYVAATMPYAREEIIPDMAENSTAEEEIHPTERL